MKKFFVTASIFALSVCIYSMDFFVNFNGEFSQTTYSFEMRRKINDKAGYFTPCWFQLDTETRVYGKTKRRFQHRSEGKLENDIVIVGRDLSGMADGNTFSLEKGQKIVKIGTYQSPSGKTYEVFSFNPKDKPGFYLGKSQKRAPGKPVPVSSSVSCPHCGKPLQIVPGR